MRRSSAIGGETPKPKERSGSDAPTTGALSAEGAADAGGVVCSRSVTGRCGLSLMRRPIRSRSGAATGCGGSGGRASCLGWSVSGDATGGASARADEAAMASLRSNAVSGAFSAADAPGSSSPGGARAAGGSSHILSGAGRSATGATASLSDAAAAKGTADSLDGTARIPRGRNATHLRSSGCFAPRPMNCARGGIPETRRRSTCRVITQPARPRLRVSRCISGRRGMSITPHQYRRAPVPASQSPSLTWSN